jgi:hypothetical protein
MGVSLARGVIQIEAEKSEAANRSEASPELQ